MDDEPIVISSGIVITPESVATRSFATGFRGYDQSEVRTYLKRVAAELTSAAAREEELREALAEALQRAANPHLDEETLTAALGEQAAKLLTNAREAAANIVSEAEKRGARVVGEAETRIARVRSEADGLLARRSEEADRMTSGLRQAAETAARSLRDRARAEAEAEVESARVQGREMVGEARAVRERMLADLTRRRRTAEVQIEHLRMARQRLLEAYAVVRRTLDEATNELGAAEAEAGPVLDAAAGRPPVAPTSEGRKAEGRLSASRGVAPQNRPAVAAPSAQELAGPYGRGRNNRAPAVEPGPVSATNGTSVPPPSEPSSSVFAGSSSAAVETVVPEVGKPQVAEPEVGEPEVAEPEVAEPEVPQVEVTEIAVVALESAEPETPASVAATSAEVAPASAPPSAEELFARLRAAQAPPPPPAGSAPPPTPDKVVARETPATPATSASPTAEPAVASGEGLPRSLTGESALAGRDRLLEPIQAGLVRQLKRVLQDEQNEVLDRLRRERRLAFEAVLPPFDDHIARYQTAATPFLRDAADGGAGFVKSFDETAPGGVLAAGSPSPRQWAGDKSAADLAVDVVAPLRERLERVISEAAGSGDKSERDTPADVAGVSDRLGACYRQWKTSQIEQAARHHASVAFTRGVFSAAPDGAELCWVVDDDGPCPDCDDNALAGAVVKGEAFPTGQTHPPAHDGCRCILVEPPL